MYLSSNPITDIDHAGMKWALVMYVNQGENNTFPSDTVLSVSMSFSFVSRLGVWSTNLQHSSTIAATAYSRCIHTVDEIVIKNLNEPLKP